MKCALSKYVFLSVLSIILNISSFAQPSEKKNTPSDYIRMYKEDAISEMLAYGIPASITLAQGMLESGNGNSALSVYANNHFGIKCHVGWTGESYIMDDDANSAAKRLAELDKANMARLNSEYLAAVSLNNLAEAAKYAAMGVKEITLGGVPISQYPAYKDNPVYQKALEIESQIALKESEAALAEANAFAARAGVSVGQSGATNNITMNTPVGSEEALTEAVQRAVQQLNRFGYSQNFAGQLL
jgi:hypothetical protein